MTGLYNVLTRERCGEDLDESDREIQEKDLVGALKELQDKLDAAVARVYGLAAGPAGR